MTPTEINLALRKTLMEELSEEQCAAINAARHFPEEDWGPSIRPTLTKANEVMARNCALPTNFTESLDACRLIENKLTPPQKRRYKSVVEREIAKNCMLSKYLLLATSAQRATALVEVLGLMPK